MNYGLSMRIALAATFFALAALATGCDRTTNADAPIDDGQGPSQESASDEDDAPDEPASRAEERQRMVQQQIEARGVDDERVLSAMRAVPRHRYVPEQIRQRAYEDSPLPIGLNQTISQPYIVALMSQLLDTSPGDRVLEIGTGSGYQAAVLAELDTEVYTIEILCDLAERAERDLEATGYGDSIDVKCGDGYKGWPEHAPFDRIIVTAAPPEIPEALVEQLAIDGLMVVPVGDQFQVLQVIHKIDEDTIDVTDIENVRFVPMVPGQD